MSERIGIRAACLAMGRHFDPRISLLELTKLKRGRRIVPVRKISGNQAMMLLAVILGIVATINMDSGAITNFITMVMNFVYGASTRIGIDIIMRKTASMVMGGGKALLDNMAKLDPRKLSYFQGQAIQNGSRTIDLRNFNVYSSSTENTDNVFPTELPQPSFFGTTQIQDVLFGAFVYCRNVVRATQNLRFAATL